MARPRKELGPGADERIRDLKRRGWTVEAIARDLGAAERTVNRRIAEMRNAAEPAQPAAEDVTVPPIALSPQEADDLAGRLQRTIANLEEASKRAVDAKDVGPLVQCSRAITQTTALLAKLTPAPAVAIDERPDMIAAAKRGRVAVHALFDRLLGGTQG